MALLDPPVRGTDGEGSVQVRMDPADRILATKRYRDDPGMRNEQIGFRCAQDV